MKIQLKENNFSIKIKKDVSNTEEPNFVRPNIDHLIKRILIERRKEQRKNFIIFSTIILVIAGSMVLSINN
tara:strand:- start:455 stop:667 length:213 start_codon:yes stop_codon:yes gene_type:complete